jgi:hypothetical protein
MQWVTEWRMHARSQGGGERGAKLMCMPCASQEGRERSAYLVRVPAIIREEVNGVLS